MSPSFSDYFNPAPKAQAAVAEVALTVGIVGGMALLMYLGYHFVNKAKADGLVAAMQAASDVDIANLGNNIATGTAITFAMISAVGIAKLHVFIQNFLNGFSADTNTNTQSNPILLSSNTCIASIDSLRSMFINSYTIPSTYNHYILFIGPQTVTSTRIDQNIQLVYTAETVSYVSILADTTKDSSFIFYDSEFNKITEKWEYIGRISYNTASDSLSFSSFNSPAISSYSSYISVYNSAYKLYGTDLTVVNQYDVQAARLASTIEEKYNYLRSLLTDLNTTIQTIPAINAANMEKIYEALQGIQTNYTASVDTDAISNAITGALVIPTVSPTEATNASEGTTDAAGVWAPDGVAASKAAAQAAAQASYQGVQQESAVNEAGGQAFALPSTALDILKDKFPFCIPFDLVAAISQMNVTQVSPIFTIPLIINNPATGESIINTNMVIDMTEDKYNTLVLIIRYGILIAFILGLISISRDMIGG